MKKTYQQPFTTTAIIGTARLICASQDITSTDNVTDIDYGGVDEEGTMTPASRRHRNVWDEDEDF